MRRTGPIGVVAYATLLLPLMLLVPPLVSAPRPDMLPVVGGVPDPVDGAGPAPSARRSTPLHSFELRTALPRPEVDDVLRSIENRIESLVTGVFGRAFRSHVQPVELARKLVKEMDDHRTVSLSRVYVPNEYHLYLSPRDREQFVGYEDGLLLELSDFLAEHARRESYSLVSSPRVLLHEDADLALGEFGISTRMAQPAASPPSPRSVVLPPVPAPVEAYPAEAAPGAEASPTPARPADAPATVDPPGPVETPPPPIVVAALVTDGGPAAEPAPAADDGTQTFEPEPERGARGDGRARDRRRASADRAPDAPCSDAPERATSRSTTRASRASMPSCAPRATAGSSPTSARRTGRSSTAAGSRRRRFTRGID